MSDLLAYADRAPAGRPQPRIGGVRILDERLTLAVVCSLTAGTLIVAVALAGLLARTQGNAGTRAGAGAAAAIERTV